MIKLPAFFSNGMMIGRTARIWGWTNPNDQLEIRFIGKVYTAASNSEGLFEAVVSAEHFGGPFLLNIGGIEIINVYVGRVWLCGGQSNMDMPISRVRSLLNADIQSDSRIHAFQIEKSYNFDGPAQDVKGAWFTADDSHLNELHATPYFFARTLLESDNTPIGLINIAAGGTSAEAWLPEECVNEFLSHAERFKQCKEPGLVPHTEHHDTVQTTIWHSELDQNDPGLLERWYDPEYNDAEWEAHALTDMDGMPEHGSVWFRKTLDLPELTGPITLRLGRAVDSVIVYVNGRQVCEVTYQYPPCACVLPANLLHHGCNVIAVRITGESNSPSFIPDKPYELSCGEWSLELNGKWLRHVGLAMPLMHPAFWFYDCPCAVYNTLLAPLLGYSVDGVIWYQGEANTHEPNDYKELFTSFIGFLRRKFRADLPVIYTQLANFIDPSNVPEENWAILREQQRQCLSIPNTAMAVTIDCGEWNDLHPQDKKTVGKRLALCAKRLVYGENIVSDGPIADSAFISDGILTIRFKNAMGLWANGSIMLEAEDASGIMRALPAKILGDTIIAAVGGLHLRRVRFAWAGCPTTSLYNTNNLPASPFVIDISETFQ